MDDDAAASGAEVQHRLDEPSALSEVIGFTRKMDQCGRRYPVAQGLDRIEDVRQRVAAGDRVEARQPPELGAVYISH